jgi:type IV pilus assembly protein PilA
MVRDVESKKAGGFTLVEVLVALLVASIVAMLAVPAYRSYATRAKISEGLTLAGPLRARIAEHFIVTGQFPITGSELGLGDPTDYAGEWTESISVTATPAAGTIVIRYSSEKLPILQANNTLLLVPSAETTGQLRWDCSAGTLPAVLRPSNCRGP